MANTPCQCLHHVPCENCAKRETEEREDLRERLRRCGEAREAERAARMEEARAAAEEAAAETKRLKKQLLAFQLATTVGITLLGQEAVARLTEKISTVKEVQAQITGGGSGGTAKPAPADPPKDKPKIGRWMPYTPRDKSQRTEIADRGNGDISGIFSGAKPGSKTDVPPEMPQVTGTEPRIPVERLIGTDTALALTEPLLPALPADPYAVFLTPSTLPFDVYSTTLALGNNYGFGEYYGMGSGTVVPTVPSPSSVAVFAIGGLVNTRRRA